MWGSTVWAARLIELGAAICVNLFWKMSRRRCGEQMFPLPGCTFGAQ